MSFLTRITDLFAIFPENGVEPEELLADILREMEEVLAAAKCYAARVLAVERGLERELKRSRTREDETPACLWEAQLRDARRKSEQVKDWLRQLEGRLAAARKKQRRLLALHESALLEPPSRLGRRFAYLERELASVEAALDGR